MRDHLLRSQKLPGLHEELQLMLGWLPDGTFKGYEEQQGSHHELSLPREAHQSCQRFDGEPSAMAETAEAAKSWFLSTAFLRSKLPLKPRLPVAAS